MGDDERRLIRTDDERQLVSHKEAVDSSIQILDEDSYTLAIDRIIERDFFPQLATLRQLNMLDPLPYQPQADPIDITNLSLDQFFHKFTSEDNHSFKQLVAKAEQVKREKLKWLYNDTKLIEPEVKAKMLEFGNGTETMVKMERAAKATNKWQYKAKNSLMYVPDHHDSNQLTESYLRSKPKIIDHSNTHLPHNLFDTVPSTPKTFTTSNSVIDHQSNNNLIENTPCINPTDLREQPMTWGTIESTPLLIPSATPGRQFSMPEPSKREMLSSKLADKARQSIRKRHLANTPRKPQAATPNLGNLTPAAKRLIKLKRTPADTQLSRAYERGSSFNTPAPKLNKGELAKVGKAGLTPNFSQFIKKK